MRKKEVEIKSGTYRVLVLCLMCSLILGVGAAAQADDLSKKEIRTREHKTLELLTNIDTYNINDDRLRADAAKAHYNMGNIYFQKGYYEIAAREYYQAVTLMPNDPDTHFNLAFVSGEYLKDFKTALKHYKMYLYLSPDARDRAFVNEKIMHAQLEIRGSVKSVLEKDFNK
ncbi:MAG: tetratricopeptide repeat protein [Candidatus Omnitrophica bacterium]|nr:tetratricopeptide repeat protein [Candidatus Omnitrophota bacterium]